MKKKVERVRLANNGKVVRTVRMEKITVESSIDTEKRAQPRASSDRIQEQSVFGRARVMHHRENKKSDGYKSHSFLMCMSADKLPNNPQRVCAHPNKNK